MEPEASPIHIEIDDQYDPPRWVRVEGLRSIDAMNRVDSKTGVIMGLVVMVPILIVTKQYPGLLEGKPWWAVLAASAAVGLGIGIMILIYWRGLRRADIGANECVPNEDCTVHLNAIRSGLLKMRSWFALGSMCIDAASFFNAYRSQNIDPPSIILHRVRFAALPLSQIESPQRFVGDPPIKWPRSVWLKICCWGFFAFSSIALISLLFVADRSGIAPSMYFSMGSMLVTSVFMLYMTYFSAQRQAITCSPGSIRYTKWFRSRSLTRDDAVCTVTRMFGMTTLEWYQTGRRVPRTGLMFRDEDDHRLATILSFWTADPLESAPSPA